MRAILGKFFLATLPLVSTLLVSSTSLAAADWRQGSFPATFTSRAEDPSDLFSEAFVRVHDSYYYRERRSDPRDRLFGGRHHYDKGYFRRGWQRPWGYGGYYGRRDRYCPPRYDRYDRYDYYRYGRPW